MTQLGDLFGIGYIIVVVHEDPPISSLLSLLLPILSFTGLLYCIRSRFRDFGAPSLT
jgi:hypothetical protein